MSKRDSDYFTSIEANNDVSQTVWVKMMSE